MEQKKRRKVVILCLLAFALFVRIIVFFTVPLGSLSHEDQAIQKNGEVIYVRGDCPWPTGNAILPAGVIDAGDASWRAFYVLGDGEREWLYVTGWRFRGFYQRADAP